MKDLQTTPFRFPPLFGGSRLLTYAFYPKGKLQEHTTTLTYDIILTTHPHSEPTLAQDLSKPLPK
jgi:hypothetical protein